MPTTRHAGPARPARRPQTGTPPILWLGGLVAVLACGEPERVAPRADLVLRGGRIVTVDPARPEASAVAVRGDRIVAVGAVADIEPYVGDGTRVIDLEGRLAVPGFIESHAHLMSLGRSRLELDLLPTTSYEDLIDRVADAVARAEPGQWIVGRGWHQSKWDPLPSPLVRGFQTHDALSAVSPDNPVYLRHASGHASLANARAMELAGVGPRTPDPEGGEIIRDAEGRPTGIFVETASELIREVHAASRESLEEDEVRAERRLALRLAAEEALGKGITTFCDAGVDAEDLALYREAIDDGDLKLRVWAMLSGDLPDLAELLPAERVIGYGGDRLTVRAIKLYADGALGSRGAWLLEPYADEAGNTGHNIMSLDTIRAAVRLALEHDYQVATHAIGDRANREVLDLYEEALTGRPEPAAEHRFRIEHAQVVHPADVPRFAQLGVIAAMQGVHAISDGPWTPDRIGAERTAERAFQFRDLVDARAIVTNGTDAPVEDVDPIPSFYGMVVGRMEDGELFNPAELLTRLEGLRAYTIDAAYAAREEDIKGSITPGKLADIVVLSRDLLAVPDEEILDTRVVLTIVGGEIVYRSDAD